MSTTDYKNLPLDDASAEKLDSRGLAYRLVDTSDATRFNAWLRADSRGFHDSVPDDARLASSRDDLGYRRTTAVVEADAAPDAEPVGTVSSWIASLTTAPERQIDAWAISAVTVRPTHAGLGVARAMLEGELRTGHAAGCAIAALTVSEATLYGRYGFATATMAAEWKIAAKRARWIGPVPSGRVELVDAAAWRAAIEPLYSRVRRGEAGHIDAWSRRFDQLAGLTGEDPDRIPRIRAARYLDTEGEVRGLMIYRVTETSSDFGGHRLSIDLLTTETDDAYAALWRLAVTMPLVTEVVAPMRRVDEPVRWMIDDQRAADISLRDNLWLRILDVPLALRSRDYFAPGSLVLHVTDPLGLTAGSYHFTVDSDLEAQVLPLSSSAPEGSLELSLGVAELSSVLLGGVSLHELASAGRVQGDPASITRSTAMFRSESEPWLPFWF